jgi:hypothetical protein
VRILDDFDQKRKQGEIAGLRIDPALGGRAGKRVRVKRIELRW